MSHIGSQASATPGSTPYSLVLSWIKAFLRSFSLEGRAGYAWRLSAANLMDLLLPLW